MAKIIKQSYRGRRCFWYCGNNSTEWTIKWRGNRSITPIFIYSWHNQKKKNKRTRTYWQKSASLYSSLNNNDAYQENFQTTEQDVKWRTPLQKVYEMILTKTNRYARESKNIQTFATSTAVTKIFIEFLIFCGLPQIAKRTWELERRQWFRNIFGRESRGTYLELKSEVRNNQNDKLPFAWDAQCYFYSIENFSHLSIDEMIVQYYGHIVYNSLWCQNQLDGYKHWTMCRDDGFFLVQIVLFLLWKRKLDIKSLGTRVVNK